MKTINTKTNFLNNENIWNKNEIKTQNQLFNKRLNDILKPDNYDFWDMIDEQSMATDISRLIWAKPWAMLEEQLSSLWLYKQKQVCENSLQSSNDNTFWAPNKILPLKKACA